MPMWRSGIAELQKNLDVPWALTGLRDFELTIGVFEITELN